MSKIDEIVEQIAFGEQGPKNGSSLGLYLSPDLIYLSETHMGKDGVLVDHLVRIPIPADEKKKAGATATMNTDFLEDPAKIGSLIKQSMSQLRWNSKTVRVTLSHHLGLLRYFTMPAMDRRYLKSAVPLEAKKYIPIPFDVLAHDFQAVPLPPDAAGKPRLGIVIAVTQRKNITNVQGLLDSLGLKLDGLEVAPLSVLRLWQAVDAPKDKAPFLHVHLDGGNVRVMVVDGGSPVFFREVFLSADPTPADLRKIDLMGCLSFVQKQLGLTTVSRVRVSGNIANLEEMKAAFAEDTHLPVVIQDTPKLLSVKSGDWGGYAALGASVRSAAVAGSTVDMAAAERVTDDERQTARDIIIAGLVAGALFAASGLLKSATYTYRAQELHKYEGQIDPDVKASLTGLDPLAIDGLLRDMQAQLDQMRAVTGASARHPKISVILKEIIDDMPSKIWLDHLSISNPLMGADKQPFDIVLRGHAQDESVLAEQALAFQLKDSLVRSPILGKTFDISLSLQKMAGGDDNSANQNGLDPKALADKLEERTSFSIELKSKH
ncbi:MAG: pilus assembly protein PilM [Elusimicrobia bacterium]|nr:pilus assembly protein PilM [Elusimicrobiota bacterium]